MAEGTKDDVEVPPRFAARWWNSLVGIVSNGKGNVTVNWIREEAKMKAVGVCGQVGNA